MSNIYKTLQPSKDVYIQFTEDEILQMNIQAGDKFDVEVLPDDEGVVFKKRKPLEIDLNEFDFDVLKNLVSESLEQDLPVGDIIVNALKQFMENELADDCEDNS